MTRATCLPSIILGILAIFAPGRLAEGEEAFRDPFDAKALEGWRARDGAWRVEGGRAVADGGFSMIDREGARPHDFELTADVAYRHDGPHAASGLAFRLGDDRTGYAAGLREIENGVHPEFGPWERPVVQLFRIDRDGWKLLQESKVVGVRSGRMSRLKVACRGPDIWVYVDDMATPILKEFDDRYDRAGAVGVWKDQRGTGLFDDVSLAAVGPTPAPPLRVDWSWVRGAVYVRSDAVNSAQMWHDYWPHVATIDRELDTSRRYGFNMVQVYLHWIVWDRHKGEYLRRIDDFLARASKAGLKVNLIFWDDCGHVEPSLAFAAPVPGRHNSQMMTNPSHAIRDSTPALDAHKERFRDYVGGIAGRFKNDGRVAFWQIYNEGMGPKERHRDGTADANLNRLLGWTRDWVKATGTSTPVTATGGGFYGPKYSDFYTYHSYASGGQPLPNADGGPEHLCTETLNRPGAGLATCLRDLAGKRNGFVVWELMIGRDNCRFPWGHADGPDEPAEPFHGVIYPDGHPWDLREIGALLGDDAFASLEKTAFRVEYFAGAFATSRKTSLTPRIDFDLGDEPGTGSPDASAGIPKDHFSIRWTGRLLAPATEARRSTATRTAKSASGSTKISSSPRTTIIAARCAARSISSKAGPTRSRSNTSTATATRAPISPGAALKSTDASSCWKGPIMATVPEFDVEDALFNGVVRPTGPMSEDEFLSWCNEDIKAEWSDGEVIIMSPSSYRHVDLVGWLTKVMGMYVSAHDLGEVLGPEFMIRLGARRRIRVPDILFIAKDRLDLIRPNHFEGAPDLAIEVVSPDSQSRDRRDKYADYQAAGVREYWIVDPMSEDLEVHTLDAEGRFRPLPVIEGHLESTVLNGFRLRAEWLRQSPLPNAWRTVRSLGLPG